MTKRWLPWLLIVGIGLAALVPRFWRLDLPILTWDEAFSWRLTGYPLGEMCVRTGADVHPPLHYILLQAWINVWGTSELALRGLSVLCGVLGIVFAFLACREAVRLFGGNGTRSVPTTLGGPAFCAILLAANSGQLLAARTARMYAPGILLAALTSWLLLKALRGGARRWQWWTGYGVALAAFCLTHNYALFTAVAQAAFVVGLVVCKGSPLASRVDTDAEKASTMSGDAGDASVRSRSERTTLAWTTLVGFVYAGVLAAILYSPWLPFLLEQTRQVRQSFWIEPITPDLVEKTFFSWAAGTVQPPDASGTWWLVLLGAALVGTVWWSGPAGWYFLVQAAAPWLGAIGFSLLSGRPIFLERCLVFGQVAWAAYWGVVWSRLGSWPARAILALGLLTTNLHGLYHAMEKLPEHPPGIVQAAAFLQVHAGADETIWVSGAADVNRLRYYLSRAGDREWTIRCTHSPFADGHVVHAAALRAEDVAHGNVTTPAPFWAAGSRNTPFQQSGQLLATHRFGEGIEMYELARYGPNDPKGGK
ncbi:MAG: glycosyltransferase family 39 protein [Gemmataceae bacterium]|nr:glycosyltransferase family 39 protein [Gemmataceae bacterium]